MNEWSKFIEVKHQKKRIITSDGGKKRMASQHFNLCTSFS